MKKVMLLTLGLMVGLMVMAQHGESQRRGHRDGRGERVRGNPKEMMAEKLNLTEGQQDEMESIRKKYMGDFQDVRNQLDIKKAELKAAIASDETRKVIDGFVKEINGLQNTRFELEISQMLDTRAILNEDQKLIFDSMHARRSGSGMHKGRF